MNKLKLTIITVFAVLGLGLVPVTASAACTTAADCVKAGVTSSGGTGTSTSLGSLIKTIVNVLLFLIGAVSVIMIIIGGIKYTVSNGDSTAVKSAKDTILYSIIGLVVAIMAYAIVSFVISRFI